MLFFCKQAVFFVAAQYILLLCACQHTNSKHPSPPVQPQLMAMKDSLRTYSSNPQRVNQLLDSAFTLLTVHRLDSSMAWFQYVKAYSFINTANELDSFPHFIYRALHNARKYQDTATFLRSANTVANYLIRFHDYKGCIQFLSPLVADGFFALERKLLPLHVNLYNALGHSFLEINQPDSCIFYLRRAIESGMQLSEKRQLISPYNSLSIYYIRQKMFVKARAAADSATAFTNKAHTGELTALEANYFDIYFGQQQYAQARQSLAKMQAFAPMMADLQWQEEVYQRAALLDSVTGNFKGAWTNQQKYQQIMAAQQKVYNQKNFVDAQLNFEKSLEEQAKNELAVNNAALRYNNLLQRAAIGLLCLLAIATTLFIVWRQRQKKRLTEQRTKRLLAEQQLKEANLKLSPHFLQNAFTVLGLAGEKQGIVNRQHYAKQLAAYFRNLLDTSQQHLHTLEAELQLAEEYLQLQQTVSPVPFQFSIQVQPDLDTYSITIPTLLLQPFLENCIKHAFPNANSINQITIAVSLNGSNVPLIAITDNGKGLQPASQREGHGLAINRAKLEHYYLDNKTNKGTFTITANTNTKGTTVTILLPQN